MNIDDKNFELLVKLVETQGKTLDRLADRVERGFEGVSNRIDALNENQISWKSKVMFGWLAVSVAASVFIISVLPALLRDMTAV